MHPLGRSEHFCAYPVRVEWTPEEIRRRRDARGLSQQDLADALQVSRRAITNWETGAAEPRGKSLRGLDRVLGDTTTPETSLRDATVLELLAELAGRYAALEAATHRGDQSAPAGEPQRYTWYKDDAPTGRRTTDPGDSDETGRAAPAETYEWQKTTGGKSARTGGNSA
jgi:transcriptional regulator with XRE-family HTH domain